MSTTFTTTASFTRTEARYLASKVAADLRQMQCFHGRPSDTEIEEYIEELTELIVGGYLASVEYGFQKNNGWAVALRYVVLSDGTLSQDERAGRVSPFANTSGASWYSYLRRTDKWWRLSNSERQQVENAIPVKRSGAPEPSTGAGYWVPQKVYSTNGVGLTRYTFQTS